MRVIGARVVSPTGLLVRQAVVLVVVVHVDLHGDLRLVVDLDGGRDHQRVRDDPRGDGRGDDADDDQHLPDLGVGAVYPEQAGDDGTHESGNGLGVGQRVGLAGDGGDAVAHHVLLLVSGNGVDHLGATTMLTSDRAGETSAKPGVILRTTESITRT